MEEEIGSASDRGHGMEDTDTSSATSSVTSQKVY